MAMSIVKRDDTLANYDVGKIVNALKLSFTNSKTTCDNMDALVKSINDEIIQINAVTINIETIQNIVENNLMKFGYYATAKHYIEYRKARQDNRNTDSFLSKIPDDVVTPWGMLGYITYKRTYARVIDKDDNTEEYRDTIIRILKASQDQLGVGFTNEELKKAYHYMMSLKCSVAGRFAWQLGTKTVDKLGIMSLQNCAFVKIDEPIKPFLWIFDVLMLGTGVGFSIEKKYVEKLPPVIDADITISRVDTKDADFIVPDSREGWVSLLEKILEAFFIKGKSFSYSTVLIRSAGSKINGFGGIASGPEDLVKGFKNLQNILSNRRGQKLSTVDCLDIVNIIATVVVAGNVRRCLPYDSMVHTQSGLKMIKDVNVGDRVLTSRGYSNVSNVFDQGKQNVVTIKTADGEFKCTPNHRMAVLRSVNDYVWKIAKDLQHGDILITPRTAIDGEVTHLPSSNNTIVVPELDENTAWFIGFFQNKFPTEVVYDRSYIEYRFKKGELSMVLRVMNFLRDLIAEKQYDYAIEFNLVHEEYYTLSFSSHEIFSYFEKYIIVETLQEFITRGTQDVRLAYIAGAIDANDTFTDQSSTLNITASKCKNFVKQLQILCYSCGFETRFHQVGGEYRIDAVTNHSVDTISRCPMLFKKSTVENHYNKASSATNSLPVNLIRKDNKYANKVRRLGLDYKKHISVNMFEECVDNINFCPVKVISVGNDTEYVDTYDIEVERYHEFYCNGYLTHNSALIALGDGDDIPYLKAKDWSSGNIPNWRCMSNNSVVCEDVATLPEEFWQGYNGTSEPYGLVNLELSRKIGRIKDGDKYPDPDVVGYNPCAEQSLANFETCCLAEIYLSNVSSYEELKGIATTVYRICKHSLSLKCHQEETEKIVHKNMRMGIGITGYMQASEEQKGWLDPLYEYLREYDNMYSEKHGFPKSVKLTTVKPSGTLSLLAGVTSGCHPAIYQYFIRRIRIASNNPLIQLCKSKGYFVEYQRNFDGTDDKNTMVVEFPCCYPIGSKLANEMTVIDQLETVKHLQTYWSDNSVSCTVYYRLEEIDTMKEWLSKNYKDGVKTCSFLLHNEHGFQQAPFEEITKEKYDEMMKKVVPITCGTINSDEDIDYSSECAGGVCPIR